jgi:predicted permease
MMKKDYVRPPKFIEKLFTLFLPADERWEKTGDLAEEFQVKVAEKGSALARLWYWGQVFKVLPLLIKNSIYWSLIMFRNYFVIALRNLLKHKGYSFINIIGLALGMACCFLILIWVQDEVKTNTFHKNIDSIYLVRTFVHHGSEVVKGTGSVPALGPALKKENPEVINAARFSNGQGDHLLEYGDKKFKERIQLADPEIFEIFTYPFVKGNPKDTYGDPYVMVLSEEKAVKYFGVEDPIGKSVTLNNKDKFRIVGVMKDIPHNSTRQFDIWVPLEFSRKLWRPNYLDTWYNLAFRTYLHMDKDVDVEAFNKKIFNRIRQSAPNTTAEPFIYPFKKVYLHVWERIDNIKIFSIIAFGILLIACINFMNLTTARSNRRAREVGMRKVIGAQRLEVMRQFFGESLLLTLIALVVSVVMVLLLLPSFRTLTGKPFAITGLADFGILLGILGITIITGIMSGSYPALFLSAFKPVKVLKGMKERGSRGSLFRKILVVGQFTLSVILIIGTIIFYKQVSFMKNKNLGLEKENLIGLRVEGNLSKNYSAMKQELITYPGITSVSVTTHSPTGVYNNGQGWDWEGKDPNVDPMVTYFGVDPDFLETFQMEMLKGESFRKGSANSGLNVIINKRFAEIISMENVLGARLSQGDRHLRVIGVVKDFHFTPVNRTIGPIILYYTPQLRPYRYMFIRVNPTNTSEIIGFLEKAYKKFNPHFPFEYAFMDEIYGRMYRGVEREINIISTFGLLAILISCLGLFGLAAYTAEQRSREIGVRKVLGASVLRIFVILSKDYIKWVFMANVLAWPIAYFAISQWLQDFAYRTPISLTIFLLSALLTLILALLTVSYQVIKAAFINPVDTLRYE